MNTVEIEFGGRAGVYSSLTHRLREFKSGEKSFFRIERGHSIELEREGQDRGAITIRNRTNRRLHMDETGYDGEDLDNAIEAGKAKPLGAGIKKVRLTI